MLCSRTVTLSRLILVVFSLLINLCSHAKAQNADLWDVSQGITVTSHSAILDTRHFAPFSTYYSDVLNMFGGRLGLVEVGAFSNQPTFFEDHRPPGFVHFVEWRTLNPMLLRRFQLWASGDGPGRGNDRDFARFALYAKNPASGRFAKIYEFFPPHPERPVTMPLEYTFPTPLTAQEFRAEFEHYPTAINESPRVYRLSGFGTFVGTPSVRIPQITVEKFLTSQWEYVFPVVNRTGIWGLRQYVLVRNIGNAPAYDVVIDGAYYGFTGSGTSALTFPPNFGRQTVSRFYPLGVASVLQPGQVALVQLVYDVPGGSFPIEGFPNVYPYASGSVRPLSLSGAYYLRPADPVTGYLTVPRASFAWSKRAVPAP